MNKSQIVDILAEKFEITKKKAEEIVDTLISEIKSAVKKGENVNLAGLGIFKSGVRKARIGINPKTKEKINIAASRVVKFRPSKEFKELIK
jgi:DNA-binding protein HU-beta